MFWFFFLKQKKLFAFLFSSDAFPLFFLFFIWCLHPWKRKPFSQMDTFFFKGLNFNDKTEMDLFFSKQQKTCKQGLKLHFHVFFLLGISIRSFFKCSRNRLKLTCNLNNQKKSSFAKYMFFFAVENRTNCLLYYTLFFLLNRCFFFSVFKFTGK